MATETPAEPASLNSMPSIGANGAALMTKSPVWQRYPVLAAQLRGFGVVAIICTVISMAIYAGLRPSLGTQWANAISLILCSILNTDLNRRFSFGVNSKEFWWRDQRRGLWIMVLALVITSGSLWLLEVLAPHASIVVELAVIVAGNIASAITRFLLLRYWIFRRLRPSRQAAS
ncbi:GtrA family protein [Arthrobacter sp. GMC3]|uniref:GtrA family protein n=1 Tax=Arthrobacter sp. GMC3 TaxID=2058894 RepID=UPI000CE459D6|nr:GtrA family protein [Arthrobacter sp. GMC3]